MKRNNKALYEHIMRSVAKEVKKTLNEYGSFEDEYNRKCTTICAIKAIRSIFKKENIDDLLIDEEHALIDDFHYLSRVYVDTYNNKLTACINDDYYPEEPDVTDYVYTFKELNEAGIDTNMVYLAVRNQLGGDYSEIENELHPWIG